MSNPKQDYNQTIRANLLDAILYDLDRNQYVSPNDKRFVTYRKADWYLDYITKFGYVSPSGGVLTEGFWVDAGVWRDDLNWNDGE